MSIPGANTSQLDPTKIKLSFPKFVFNSVLSNLGDPSKVHQISLVAVINTKNSALGQIVPLPLKIELEGQLQGPDIGDIVQSAKMDITVTGRAFSIKVFSFSLLVFTGIIFLLTGLVFYFHLKRYFK